MGRIRQSLDQPSQCLDAALHVPVQLFKHGAVCLRGQQTLFHIALLTQQGVDRLQTGLHSLDLPAQPVELGEVLLPYRHTAMNGDCVKLGIAVPQQRMGHIHGDPPPDGAGDGRRAPGGQDGAALLIQQRQPNGSGGEQALILKIDRDKPRVEGRLKKQGGQHADVHGKIALPRQRHPPDVSSDVGQKPRAEQQRNHPAGPVGAIPPLVEQLPDCAGQEQEG